LDNIVSIKRKAQKLVQQGAYAEAIEHYTMVVESGEMDPYDFVVLGDLLLRDNRKDEAIDRYQEALSKYADGGLNRNAIALAKRIKRLSPSRFDIQQRLGDFYAAEGLNSEAALHYLEYLEKARGAEDFPNAAQEICSKLLAFPLPSFELVPRIVAIAQEIQRGPSMARGVLYQAERAENAGHEKVKRTLTDLAYSLDPNVTLADPVPEPEVAAPAAEPAVYMDPGAMILDDIQFHADDVVHLEGPGVEPEPLAMPEEPYDPTAVSLDAGPGEVEDEPHVPELDLSDFDLETANPDHETTELKLADAAGEPGVLDLSEAEATSPGLRKAEPPLPAPLPAGALREKAERALAGGDPIVAQREFMKAARAYAEGGDVSTAEHLFQKVVQLDPNHLDALRGLAAMAKKSGDQEKLARYACELGDALIAREKYDEALLQFEAVLTVDPGNSKATSRVSRLKHMASGEADTVQPMEAPDSRPPAGMVTVRDDEGGVPTQTSQELAAILDEFRSAVVDSIPAADAQAHYDMGMAYHEMDLIDEAIVEFQSAAENEDVRLSSLEMLAECYIKRARSEEAIPVLEEVLAYAEDDEARSRIHFAIGKAREALGLLAEAEQAYFQALEFNNDFLEAAERLTEMEHRKAEGA
jgi:tetratricopeptide (TPR) repeat protein